MSLVVWYHSAKMFGMHLKCDESLLDLGLLCEPKQQHNDNNENNNKNNKS